MIIKKYAIRNVDGDWYKRYRTAWYKNGWVKNLNDATLYDRRCDASNSKNYAKGGKFASVVEIYLEVKQ